MFTFVFVVVMKKYVNDDEAYKKTAYIFLGHLAVLAVIAIALWGSQTGTTPPTQAQYKAFDSKFVWLMAAASLIYMIALRKKVFNISSFYMPLITAGVILGIAYPGIVKIFPKLLSSIGGADVVSNMLIVLVILAALVYLVYWSGKNKKGLTHIASIALLFALIGFSTYAMIIIRSNQHTPMNENSPDNMHKLLSYL